MPAQVLLLRAVNVGQRRVAMAALRELLSEAGMQDVRTYLQSGNVVVSDERPPEELENLARDLISGHFGFDVPVIVRTAAELERVVRRGPNPGRVEEPKRSHVVFLERSLGEAELERLRSLVAQGEQLVAEGRELFVWLPEGVGRSKLATALPAPGRGVLGTARNWGTVVALAELAGAAT